MRVGLPILLMVLSLAACASTGYEQTLSGEATPDKPFFAPFGNGLYLKVTAGDEIRVGAQAEKDPQAVNYAMYYTPPYRNHNDTMLNGSYGMGLVTELALSPRTLCYLADPAMEANAGDALDKIIFSHPAGEAPADGDAELARLVRIPHGQIDFEITGGEVDEYTSIDKHAALPNARVTRMAFTARVTYPAKPGACTINALAAKGGTQ